MGAHGARAPLVVSATDASNMLFAYASTLKTKFENATGSRGIPDLPVALRPASHGAGSSTAAAATNPRIAVQPSRGEYFQLAVQHTCHSTQIGSGTTATSASLEGSLKGFFSCLDPRCDSYLLVASHGFMSSFSVLLSSRIVWHEIYTKFYRITLRTDSI